MIGKGLAKLLVVSTLTLFLMVQCAAAQTNLIPNEPLDNETIYGSSYDFYVANSYQITLDAGNWTIAMTSLFDLELTVKVATDSGMTDIIAEIDGAVPDPLLLSFDLSSSTTVYIRVEDGSAYGDSSGIYIIGVYDDAHLASATQNTLTIPTTFTIPTGPSLDMFTIMPIIIFAAFGVIAIAVCIFLVKARSSMDKIQDQIIQAPYSAIPQRYQGRVEGDDGLRAVRVPVKCPNCDAPLSSETIDWVGPLEAKCSYCGSTVRAKFERI